MRRIIQNTLLIFLLVPAMVQSGMAKWAPRLCGDMGHGAHAVHADAAQARYAQHEHCRVNDQALAGNGGHRHLMCIGCGFTGGNDVTLLPAKHVERVLRPALLDDPATASVASIALAPPTPPPRS